MTLLLLGADQEFDARRELFGNGEIGVIGDIADMNRTKLNWRRNLLTYSEQLTTSPWSANEASLESATPPSGISLAWKLKETGNSGVHFVGRVLNTVLSASVQHTLSVYAKAGERNILSIVGESTATTLCDFDLSAGTAHPAASATGTITSVGDGWYRCSMTWTAVASPSTTYFATKQSLAGGLVFTGTLNSGIFLAAAQLERASSPTEYQPITDFATEFKAAFPNHAIYQDSNGVTPVTAVGDLVGLVIDKSQGGLDALGPELVTNGGFADATGWTVGAIWSISGGVATHTGTAGNLTTSSSIATTAGKWYRIEYDISGNTGAGATRIDSGGAFTGTNAPFSYVVSGKYSVILQAGATGALFVYANNAFNGSVDNISVREIPGHHIYQSTSGSRPSLSRVPFGGRRNLLNESERFDQASWAKQNTTVTANAASNYQGQNTADLIVGNATVGSHYINHAFTPVAGTPHTLSVKAKAGDSDFIQLVGNGTNFGTDTFANFDLNLGEVKTVGSDATAAIESLGDGWYLCSLTTSVPISTALSTGFVIGLVDSSSAARLVSFDATGHSVYVDQAQVEASGSLSNYQRTSIAGTVVDCVEQGVPDCWYLDTSSNKWMQTAAIDFTATDEMTVIAGVRKLSDAADGMVVELSANASTNTNSFYLTAPEITSGQRYSSLSRGNAAINANQKASFGSGTGVAPDTCVLSTTHDISSDLTTLRRNGTAATNATGDKGSGNFGNYALYIASRGGSTVFFNGYLFSFIVRGKTTEGSKLTRAEKYIAKKTGLTI